MTARVAAAADQVENAAVINVKTSVSIVSMMLREKLGFCLWIIKRVCGLFLSINP